MKKFKIHPLFVVMAFVFVVLGLGKAVISAFVALLVHELGHYLMAKKYGYEIGKLYLLPFGANLNLKQSALIPKDEIIIAAMGPIFSLASAMICVCFWWLFPVMFGWTHWFVSSCIALFCINLLPAFPLDGGRILWAVLCNQSSAVVARKTMVIFNIFFSALFFVMFATSFFDIINLSFAFMSFFLIQGIFENKFSSQYGRMMYHVEKRKFKNQILSVKTFVVTPKATILHVIKAMSKTKANQVLVHCPNGKVRALYDSQIEAMSEKYALTTKMEEIFKNNVLN